MKCDHAIMRNLDADEYCAREATHEIVSTLGVRFVCPVHAAGWLRSLRDMNYSGIADVGAPTRIKVES